MNSIEGALMNTNKISLSLLRGRAAGQSAPSMSFRFNTASDNITQVSPDEEPEKREAPCPSSGANESASNRDDNTGGTDIIAIDKSQSNDKPNTGVKSQRSTNSNQSLAAPGPILRSHERRSSSLDEATTSSESLASPVSCVPGSSVPECSSLLEGASVPVLTSEGLVTSSIPATNTSSTSSISSTSTGGGLFSRLSKTFEVKLNEIRQEKLNRDRDKAAMDVAPEEDQHFVGMGMEGAQSLLDSSSIHRSLADSAKKTFDVDYQGTKSTSISLTNSPSKKTSLAQDLAGFRTEFGRNIPKLSELRNRKSNNKDRSRSSFTLNSILGRDDGLPLEDLMTEECEGFIEAGVEAEEGVLLTSPASVSVTYIPTSELPVEDPSSIKEFVQQFPQIIPENTQVINNSFPDRSTQETQSPSMKARITKALNDYNIFQWPVTRFVLIVAVLCILLPLPSFLSGFIVGGCLSGLLCSLILKLLLPNTSSSSSNRSTQSMQRPKLLDLPSDHIDQHYKGWLNKLDNEYYPDSYHVSLTHSVYVRLQGSTLQIDHPRRKISKHCRYGEELLSGGFVHHREYDLSGASIMLMPRNLPRRWLWSRKYPICLKLQNAHCSGSQSQSSSASTSRQGTPVRSIGVTTSAVSSTVSTPVRHLASTPLKAVPGAADSVLATATAGAAVLATATAEGAVLAATAAGAADQPCDTNCATVHGKDNPRSYATSATRGSKDVDDATAQNNAASAAADLDSFEEVTKDMCMEQTLYLFARSDREKDDWFRRFVAASEFSHEHDSRCSSSMDDNHSRVNNTLAAAAEAGASDTMPDASDFSNFMAALLHPPRVLGAREVTWVNAMAGRLLYDFLHNPYWANKIQERVQRKLSKVHVPHLVGELVVCGVQLGGTVPQLRSVGTPRQDQRGLWCDLNVEYEGNFTMTIETKLDLMKLKKSESLGNTAGTATATAPSGSAGSNPRVGSSSSSSFHNYTRSASSHDMLPRDIHFDTDTDDSVESSSDEEVGDDELGASGMAGESLHGGGRRFLKLVDSVAGNRYFQQAADTKLIQKAMRGVSNTRIVLSVKVERLCGTLTVNIPPQPSDRLWYGFKTPPELIMLAQPRLGDRSINLPFLSEFIQKQLHTVFEKVFVLPNMDDLVVPIMSPLLPGQTTLPRPPWETNTQGASASSPTIPAATATRRGSATSAATPDDHVQIMV
uniref:Testis-expressed sequence 2 protein-like n=2 Tax=Hirondellea gigas TaxID=1518452 RepID=A0A6A7FXD1_9CRUS